MAGCRCCLLLMLIHLFFAKDCEGIDPGGAEGGDEAGAEGDEDEQDGYGEEGCEIAGAYSVDHAGDDAAEAEGCDQSDDDAGEGGLHALNDDEAGDVAQGGAEGDAQADLLHAAFYGVGEHAVDADGAENEGEQAEDGEQLHVEAVLGQGLAYVVFERQHVVYRDVFVDLVYGVGYGDGESLRWRCGADGEGERAGAPGGDRGAGDLRDGPVEGGDAGGAVEAELLYVAYDAYNLAILVGKEGELEMVADGAAVGPELFGHGLADDDDGC
jgi:hypothetical protein